MTNNVLSRFSVDIILGVSWIIAWAQVLYADELPGDGFTGGVLFLIALMLEFEILGYRMASAKLPGRIFYAATAAGAVLMLGLLIGPPMLGRGLNLLESFKIPLGFAEVSSTLLFDLALFLLVTGGAVSFLSTVEEEGR